MLVRLLSHPSPSTPSISRLAVSWETRPKDRSNNHGLRIRRSNEHDSKFLHLTPLPRCTNLFSRCPLG